MIGSHLEPLDLLERDACAVELLHSDDQPVEIPVLEDIRADVALDDVLDHLGEPVLLDVLGEILALQHPAALLVDHAALDVHHVVVLENVLALDEVLLFDLLLRVLDLAREDRRLHRLVIGELEALHDVLDPVAGEEADEVVLAGEVEARLAGVALAA